MAQTARKTSGRAKAPVKTAKLPAWNLADLYTGTEAPQIKQDLEHCRIKAGEFRKQYEGKVEALDAPALVKAIHAYESMQEILGRLSSYAQLIYAENNENIRNVQFYQNIQEAITDISSQLLFFTLSLNLIDEARMKSLLAHAPLAHYAPWLRDVRTFKPYQLSQELETLLHEKYVAGVAAWTRLFDETMSGLRFPMGKKRLTSAEIFDYLSSKKKSTRKKAAKTIGKVLGDNIKLFALITNTLAKDKEIEDKWRGFAHPISSRNVSNHVEDEVVEALIYSVSKNYERLSHRYYKLKAKWFGVKQLDYWDRNAPLPKDKDRLYAWDEAKELVLSSYRHFSPRLAEIGQEFFDKKWIDVPVRPGKSPGAFAHPTVPSAHPYLLLNYQGRVRDVMTLAHELGHGVHQVLSAPKGMLMSDTPLTLAETASVFGEQLTFRELLRREKDTRKRQIMIAGKVEDMLNTVVRQTAFCEFEKQVHSERRKGELTPERIGQIWMHAQKESLGPAIRYSDEYQHYWSYIPHFIHSPFYVYAYAFGDCLVNSLYAVYEAEQKKGKGALFEKKYIAMLEAGGTQWHKELLAPFGLDASDPAFWQKGLDIIAGYIDELE